MNVLKKIIPSLTITNDLTSITLDVTGMGRIPKEIAMLTPLYHLLDKRYTIPRWTTEQWEVFGKTCSGRLDKNTSLRENMVTPKSNSQLNILRQQIDAVVTQKHAVEQKTRKATKSGDGKKNLKINRVKNKK